MKLINIFAICFLVMLLISCSGSDNSKVSSINAATLLASNANYPQIGAGEDGNMIVIWDASDGVYANNYIVNSGWGTPQKIADGTRNYYQYTKLTVNKNGDAIVALAHYQSGNNIIITCRYHINSGWDTPKLINFSDSEGLADIALNDSDTAFMIWTDRNSSNNYYSMYASRALSGSGWESPQVLCQSLIYPGRSRIAVDGNGNAFVLWIEMEMSVSNVYVNRYSENLGWGTPQLISSSTGIHYAGRTNIAFDHNGNALAVWYQMTDNFIANIFSCSYAAGSGWGAAEKVDNGSNDFSVMPYLNVGWDGLFRVIWNQTGISYDQHIYYRSYSVVTGWDALQELSLGNAINVLSPRIAADASGSFYAAWWQEIKNYNSCVYTSRYRAGTGWDTPVQHGTTTGYASSTPELAVDPQGNAMLTWGAALDLTSMTDLYFNRL